MVEIITYSLRGEQKRSDQYYRDIADFTDEVLLKISNQADDLIIAYMDFLERQEIEKRRGFDEYGFELLMLGIFWRLHGQNAIQLTNLPQHSLAARGKIRKRVRPMRPVVDWLRGRLGTIYLISKNGNTQRTPEPTVRTSVPVRYQGSVGAIPNANIPTVSIAKPSEMPSSSRRGASPS